MNYKNCKSLIYAAYYDYVDIVKALLSRSEINFDSEKTLKYADVKSKKIIKNYLKNNQKGTTNSWYIDITNMKTINTNLCNLGLLTGRVVLLGGVTCI